MATPKMRKLGASINKKFKTTGANQGFGRLGPWPYEQDKQSREVVAILTGITVKWDGKFHTHFTPKHPRNKELDAMSFQVHYLHRFPDGKEMKFDGRPLYIPLDADQVPPDEDEKKYGKSARKPSTNVDYALADLKGQLQGILGFEPTDIDAALAKAVKIVEDANAKGEELEANVYLDFRSYEKRDAQGKVSGAGLEKRDYVRSLVSADEHGADGTDDEEIEDDHEEEEEEDEDLVEEDDEEEEEEEEEEPAPAPTKKKKKSSR